MHSTKAVASSACPSCACRSSPRLPSTACLSAVCLSCALLNDACTCLSGTVDVWLSDVNGLCLFGAKFLESADV